MTNSSSITSSPLVSILINNYNYGDYLKEAIDSAIDQDYSNIEVIVVDDGSNDNSKKVIEDYGSIKTIFTKNKGQASALNSGFDASKGDIICFLDADDLFLSSKVSQIVNFFSCGMSIKQDIILFHLLEVIDKDSNCLGTIRKHSCELSDLNRKRAKNYSQEEVTKICDPEEVYEYAKKYRYVPFLASATSSLVLTRSLAKKVFPLPSKGIKTSADDFVVKAASLIGEVYIINRPLAYYRVHDSNNWYGGNKSHDANFLNTLDNFLNSKLELCDKKPVLSYFNSLHALKFYQRLYSAGKLRKKRVELAFKIITWYLDMRTFKFFIRTIVKVTFDINTNSESRNQLEKSNADS